MKISEVVNMSEEQLRKEIAKKFKFVFASFDSKGKLMFVSDDVEKLRLYTENQLKQISGSVSEKDYEIRETVLV